MTEIRPSMPPEGTDQHRLLLALLLSFPAPFWSPNSRLELTAHSRVPELRKLGWEIEHVSRARPPRADGTKRKREHGYQLHTPGHTWPPEAFSLCQSTTNEGERP